MRSQKTTSGVIYEVEKGVIYFRYYEEIEVTKNHLVENFTYLEEYVKKNGKIKLIIEIPSSTFESSEAFDYTNEIKYKKEYTLAVALIVKSLAQKLNSKYYNSKIDSAIPASFFKSYDEALKWIKTICVS